MTKDSVVWTAGRLYKKSWWMRASQEFAHSWDYVMNLVGEIICTFGGDYLPFLNKILSIGQGVKLQNGSSSLYSKRMTRIITWDLYLSYTYKCSMFNHDLCPRLSSITETAPRQGLFCYHSQISKLNDILFSKLCKTESCISQSLYSQTYFITFVVFFDDYAKTPTCSCTAAFTSHENLNKKI